MMNKVALMMLWATMTFYFLAPPALAATVIKQEVCTGAAANSSVCKTRDTTENPIIKAINTAANILAVITGVAAVIMIIVGGLTMVTSAGNTENVTKARRRIIYSVVGLVVVALAWTIVHFVTNRLIQ